jgi:hypothetical protein
VPSVSDIKNIFQSLVAASYKAPSRVMMLHAAPIPGQNDSAAMRSRDLSCVVIVMLYFSNSH